MMNSPIETPGITTESASPSTKNKWRPRLGSALLVVVWLMICHQLSLVWTINAQYSHGWLVPILCIYLAGKSSLPANHVPESESARSSITLWLLGGVSLLLIFPAWIIREANSDWRLINVVLVGLAMTLTFAMIHHEGGWPKTKALIFAILFFLVAVPWPLATDLQLTLWLQGKVSGIIVDALLLLGYQVELQGHVIHVPPFGHVGVDEACSGIRGLQASIVVSLFIGQYYRFSILHRFLFCFIGLALALMANMGRAFVLALYATRGKIDMVNEWHDSAGLIETASILVGLLICSQLIKNKNSAHVLGETNFEWTSLKTAPPLPFSIAGLTAIATTLIASFLHYFLNERDMNPISPLKIDFTTGDI
ncbi:MAG: exosortase/archaeosortase family protein, partial [Opitutales bacterium]